MNVSTPISNRNLHPRFTQRLQEFQAVNPYRSACDQVVGIVPLSDRVPSAFLAQSIAHTLRTETGASVIVVNVGRASSNLSLDKWDQVASTKDSPFCLGNFLEVSDGGLASLTVQVSGPTDSVGSLSRLVEHCANHFNQVILHTGIEVVLPTVLEAIRSSSRTFMVGIPAEEDFCHRELLIQSAAASTLPTACQLKTVLYREKPVNSSTDFVRSAGTRLDGTIQGGPSKAQSVARTLWPDRNFNADIRRIAREISRRRIGLALSSGGARGLAHIGVIQVLEENGIEVDAIVGCSMGSYVGAVWAYGFDGVAMERLAREVEHPWGLFELIDPFLLPRQGFLRGEKVKMRLKRSIGDVHFEELVRPLRIVATHLATLGRVVFSTGEVAQAVHASSAIPGACVPVSISGELYIDGGIADPLPVDVLEEMGIEKIIAVNTIPTPDYLRSRLEIERERNLRLGRRSSKFKTFVNRYLNYFAPGNVLDTILRSFNGAQMQVAEHSCMFADLVLRPLSFDGRWHDFRRPGKYIAIGRREAEQHLDEIKSLVNQKEVKYETIPAQQSLGTPA